MNQTTMLVDGRHGLFSFGCVGVAMEAYSGNHKCSEKPYSHTMCAGAMCGSAADIRLVVFGTAQLETGHSVGCALRRRSWPPSAL